MNDEQCIASFFTYLLTERRVSQNTYLAYNRDIEQLKRYMQATKVSCNVITLKILKAYIHQLKNQGIRARSIARKITVIKSE